MSEIWFNVLYSFFATLLITIPLIIFTDIEKKRLNYIICFILTYIIAYISTSISKQFGMLLLFINCITYLYSVFNNITYSIIMYILICFSICIADALIGFIFLIFFNLSYSELMDNSLIKLLINIANKAATINIFPYSQITFTTFFAILSSSESSLSESKLSF